MNIYFVNGGFQVSKTDIDGAVKLSQSEYAALMQGQAKGGQIKVNESGKPYLVDLSIEQQRINAKNRVDLMAGQARSRFVSQGSLIQEEYRAAAAEVAEYRQTGDVPSSLQLWADLSGQSVDESASEIEQTAALYSQVLLAIREIRLTAKVAIDKAEADTINEILQNAETLFDEL